jgi:hypothetical protein
MFCSAEIGQHSLMFDFQRNISDDWRSAAFAADASNQSKPVPVAA